MMAKTKPEIKRVSPQAIVRQSHELVEANYKLTAAEQKIILNFIAQIDSSKTELDVMRIGAKSLSDSCGFNPQSGYRQLQTTLKKLLNRSIILQRRDGSGWYGTHWVQSCDYVRAEDGDSDCSYVEFEMDNRLYPHFLQLRERFLKSDLKSLVSFSHVYSTRFYMIFKNRLKIGHVRYSFEEIIKLLELSKTYAKRTTNIKEKVIKVAVVEINEKSDLHVDYSYYKEGGRSHVGVDFEFYQKPQAQPKPISKRPTKRVKLSDEQQEMYDRLTNPDRWNITEDVARKMLKAYPLDVIDANLDYAYRYRKGKVSLGGWLISCIEKDAAGEEKKRKAERKEAAKRQRAKAKEAADLKVGGIGAEPDAAAKAVEKRYAEDAKKEVQPDDKLPDFVVQMVKHYKSEKSIPQPIKKVLQGFGLTYADVMAGKR